jgi:hypothetical protein
MKNSQKQASPEESNLVFHAMRELKTIREDKTHSEGLVKMVEIFASMGHSAGSAGVAIAQLNALLQFQNLSPLTDDENEWVFHGNNVWQNARNGEAFSNDGGKTYYLLSEGGSEKNPAPLHNSRYHKPCPRCGARELHQHHVTCIKSLETTLGV